jgi:hypothetical protein
MSSTPVGENSLRRSIERCISKRLLWHSTQLIKAILPRSWTFYCDECCIMGCPMQRPSEVGPNDNAAQFIGLQQTSGRCVQHFTLGTTLFERRTGRSMPQRISKVVTGIERFVGLQQTCCKREVSRWAQICLNVALDAAVFIAHGRSGQGKFCIKPFFGHVSWRCARHSK